MDKHSSRNLPSTLGDRPRFCFDRCEFQGPEYIIRKDGWGEPFIDPTAADADAVSQDGWCTAIPINGYESKTVGYGAVRLTHPAKFADSGSPLRFKMLARQTGLPDDGL